MKRIAVLVSGGGTNLQALIDAQQRNELGGGQIVAVISSKAGAYALERAKNAGIEGFTLPRKEFDSNQSMTIEPADPKDSETFFYMLLPVRMTGAQ